MISLSSVSRSIKLQNPNHVVSLYLDVIAKGHEKHTRNLASNRSADLSLGILQELDEGGDHIACNNLLVHGLGNLLRVVSD